MSTDERESWARRILDCLEGPGGEVAARARTADLATTYGELDRDARRRFLGVLAKDFGTSRPAVDEAIERYRAAQSPSERATGESALRDALTPPRRRLLTQFNGVEGGVKFLVDLRADLLSIASQSPALGGLDDDLKELLSSWLDFGFLELTRLTWRSPAALLEKIIAYEAVHAIRDWEDLRNRLDSDRRCYGLFHPSMPGEPLAFVEVALCNGTARSVQRLLDESAPAGDARRADTAVFYSISSPQKGLRGISFGEYLIKRTVDALSHDLPRLARYATLSPIPGFRVWLDHRLTRQPDSLVVPGTAHRLGPGSVRQLLDEPVWTEPTDPAHPISDTLLPLCARYFSERRADGQPIDPVARFHLRNGARLDRINWLGDVSPKGLRQSLGLMVNYRYDLDDIDENHEAYANERALAVSPAVERLMARGGGDVSRVRSVEE